MRFFLRATTPSSRLEPFRHPRETVSWDCLRSSCGITLALSTSTSWRPSRRYYPRADTRSLRVRGSSAVGAFGAILYVLFGIGNRLLFLTLLFAISRYLYECPDKLLCLSPEEFLWTPYVTILPFWALLLFLADLPHRPALAVPACILACFVIQTHVGYFPVVGTMGLLSALFILERQWGDPFRSRKPTAGHSQRVGFWLSWTLVLGVLLWTPPVIEEITGYPGNLSALIGFFGDGTSLQHELGAVLYVFAQQSAAAISGLTGGAVEPRAQPWVVVLELVVLCAGLIASLRTRQRYLTGLQAHCLLALLVAGVSIMAIRGEVLHYLVAWMSVLHYTSWTVSIFALACAFGTRPLQRVQAQGFGTLQGAACVGVFATYSIWAAWGHLGMAMQEVPYNPDLLRAKFRPALHRLIDRSPDASFGLHMDQDTWYEGAGVASTLLQASVPFAIDGSWKIQVGSNFRHASNWTHEIRVQRGPAAPEEGFVTLAQHAGFFVLVREPSRSERW